MNVLDIGTTGLPERCDIVWYYRCPTCGIESCVTIESTLSGWWVGAATRRNGCGWSQLGVEKLFCTTRFGRWVEVTTARLALVSADKACHRRVKGETT